MKTAIYIEDSIQQLVLTPQDKFEENILGLLEKELGDKVYRGSFYGCRGGWIRHSDVSIGGVKDDSSLIILTGKQNAS